MKTCFYGCFFFNYKQLAIEQVLNIRATPMAHQHKQMIVCSSSVIFSWKVGCYRPAFVDFLLIYQSYISIICYTQPNCISGFYSYNENETHSEL